MRPDAEAFVARRGQCSDGDLLCGSDVLRAMRRRSVVTLACSIALMACGPAPEPFIEPVPAPDGLATRVGEAPEVPELYTPAAVLHVDSLIGRALLRNDTAGIAMYQTDDWESWQDGLIVTKSELLASFTRSGRWTSIEQLEQQVTIADDDAFVAGLIVTTYGSRPYDVKYRMRYVRHYVVAGGGWRLRSTLIVRER